MFGPALADRYTDRTDGAFNFDFSEIARVGDGGSNFDLAGVNHIGGGSNFDYAQISNARRPDHVPSFDISQVEQGARIDVAQIAEIAAPAPNFEFAAPAPEMEGAVPVAYQFPEVPEVQVPNQIDFSQLQGGDEGTSFDLSDMGSVTNIGSQMDQLGKVMESTLGAEDVMELSEMGKLKDMKELKDFADFNTGESCNHTLEK